MFAADGAHSKVRQALGITLEGSSFPEDWPLYDIELDDPLDSESAHVSFVEGGMVFLLCLEPGVWRLFGNLPGLLERLPRGTKAGAIHWQSTFHVSDCVASRESVGRVVLAGDAAHVHAPVAARGMNLGIEDAFVFARCAVDALHGNLKRLSDYGLMRHEVHARVVARIDRLTRLARGQPPIVGLLRRLMPAITTFGPTHRSMVELVTGLDHPIKVDLS
jgi:2-polyprenyl-6-methoxyphenol hydroxylase-like FAD-dependent oxidoreductase